MIRAAVSLSIATAVLGLFAPAAAALPLAAEECERVRAEKTNLEQAGVAADMAQGAGWARANLSPDRLKRVQRWIELEEQVLFRCPRPKPPPPADAAADSGVSKPGTAPAQAKKPQQKQQKPERPPTAGAARQPTDNQRQNSGAAGLEGVAKPAKPQQKKPKVEDAYKPPAPLSGDLEHAAPWLSVPAPGGTGAVP
jgi:hypothetical protein